MFSFYTFMSSLYTLFIQLEQKIVIIFLLNSFPFIIYFPFLYLFLSIEIFTFTILHFIVPRWIFRDQKNPPVPLLAGEGEEGEGETFQNWKWSRRTNRKCLIKSQLGKCPACCAGASSPSRVGTGPGSSTTWPTSTTPRPTVTRCCSPPACWTRRRRPSWSSRPPGD